MRKNLIPQLLSAAILAVATPPLPAQEFKVRPPNRDAVTVTGANADGFPKQGLHQNEPVIPRGGASKFKGTLIWIPEQPIAIDEIRQKGLEEIMGGQLSIPIKNCDIEMSGNWRLAADNVLNPVTAPADRQISVTNSIEVSEETAREYSASLAVTAGFEGKVVKAEATATVGYARTASEGKAKGESWTHTVSVAPGQGMQGWQRELKLVYTFDTSKVYKDRGEYIKAVADYWASQKFPGNETKVGSYAFFKKVMGPEAALGWALGATGAAFLDFEKFKGFGKVTVVHEIPYPEFYATYYQIPESGIPFKSREPAGQAPGPELIPTKP
jgi:hypothetical protein